MLVKTDPVSKRILDKINSACRDATEVSQWKNTQDVLQWFTHVHSNNPTKEKARLLKFDDCEFYPSISEDLLRESMSFAKKPYTHRRRSESNNGLPKKCLVQLWKRMDQKGQRL